MEADKATIIDADATLEGKLTGKDVRVLGRFKGEIEVSGRLLIGDGAKVEAKVKADVAEISGEFKGDITTRSLLLLEKARVEGTFDAHVLAVREGAHLNGSVDASSTKGTRPKPTAPPVTG